MSRGKEKSWWDRNWYWAIPTGCLGCLGMVIGSCVVMIGGIFGTIRGSEPFEVVLDRARSDPRVIEALGEPIREGWAVSGNFSLQDDSREADLTIPISGPKGDAELHVVAHREGDEWTYDVMEVRLENSGGIIDLLSKPPVPTSSVRRLLRWSPIYPVLHA